MPLNRDAGLPDTASRPGAWFQPRASLTASLGKHFFLLIVTAYFALSFGSNASFLNMRSYTEGLAPTPYQYRVLPMFAFRALMRVPLVMRVAQHVQALHNDPYRLIGVILAFVFMAGAIYVVQAIVARLTGDKVFAFWIAFLVPFMALLQLSPSTGLIYTLPYDVPALFFFALSVYLIISGRHVAFLLLFPIAVLNRETACFTTVFFVIWEWVRLAEAGASFKSRVLRIAPLAAVQAVVWLAIKIYLQRHFIDNPVEGHAQAGGLFTSRLGYNLRELPNPLQWPVLLSVCGFSLPFLYLQRRWIRCDGLFWVCAILMPIYFVGMMLVGVIVEIRIFTEWIAIVVPTLALIVHNRFRPSIPAEL